MHVLFEIILVLLLYIEHFFRNLSIFLLVRPLHGPHMEVIMKLPDFFLIYNHFFMMILSEKKK